MKKDQIHRYEKEGRRCPATIKRYDKVYLDTRIGGVKPLLRMMVLVGVVSVGMVGNST